MACLYQTGVLRGRVQRHEAIHFPQLAAQRIVHSFREDEVATLPLLCVSRASHTHPFRPIPDFQQRRRLDVDADAVVDELRVRRGRNGCPPVIVDEGLDIPVKHRVARDLDVKGRNKHCHHHLARENPLQLQLVVRVGPAHGELVGVGQPQGLEIPRQHHFRQVVLHRLLQNRVQRPQHCLWITSLAWNHLHLADLLPTGDALLDLFVTHTVKEHHGVLQSAGDHRVDNGLRKRLYALLGLCIILSVQGDKTRHADHIGGQPLRRFLVVVYFQFLRVTHGMGIEP